MSTSLDIGSTRFTINGDSLYRSDLDGSNSVLLHQWPAAADQPANLFNYNGTLLFSAGLDASDTGAELWKSDGTANGTTFVSDYIAGHAGTNPHDFHLMNNNAVYLGVGTHNEALVYGYDGSNINQLLVPDPSIAVYAAGQGVRDVTWIGNSVSATFNRNDTLTANFAERWTSDGTVAGTHYAYSLAASSTLNLHGTNVSVVPANTGYLSVTIDGAPTVVLGSSVSAMTITAASGANSTLIVNQNLVIPATITGGAGDDTLYGGGADDSLLGGAGNDVIIPFGGINTVDGGADADTIIASVSHDTIVPDSTDTIRNTDNNSFDGSSNGAGSNAAFPYTTFKNGILRVYGSPNDDTLKFSASGNTLNIVLDTLLYTEPLASVHTMILFAGNGNDTIDFSTTGTFTSKIYGEAGNDNISAGDGKDRIYGGDGDDWIDGAGNADTIYGEAGNDRLFGQAGRDYINAGAGTNLIRGGTSRDQIFASAGDDYHGHDGDLLTLLA